MGDSHPRRDTLAFQVDLWSARGELPRTIAEVSTRKKEIQYSSRNRAGTDSFKNVQRLRRATADLLEKLPEPLQKSPEAQLLRTAADYRVYNIVHLIYRARNYEGHSKDYEFLGGSLRKLLTTRNFQSPKSPKCKAHGMPRSSPSPRSPRQAAGRKLPSFQLEAVAPLFSSWPPPQAHRPVGGTGGHVRAESPTTLSRVSTKISVS